MREHVGRGGTCAHLRMLWDSEAWRRKPGRFSGPPSCHRPLGSWRLTLFRRAGFLGLCPPGSWRREREPGCDSMELRASPAASALPSDMKTQTGQTSTPADPEPLSHSEGQMGPFLVCPGARHSLPQVPIQGSPSRSWPWLSRRLARLCVFESALGFVGGTRSPPRGPGLRGSPRCEQQILDGLYGALVGMLATVIHPHSPARAER